MCLVAISSDLTKQLFQLNKFVITRLLDYEQRIKSDKTVRKTLLLSLKVQDGPSGQLFMSEALYVQILGHYSLSCCCAPLRRSCPYSFLFFELGAQNWTEYSRCDLTKAKQRGRITSHYMCNNSFISLNTEQQVSKLLADKSFSLPRLKFQEAGYYSSRSVASKESLNLEE